MAEEENKNINTEPPAERSWGEAAIDVIGSIADGYARTGRLGPALMSGVGAAFNTDRFQAEKMKLANMRLAQQEQINASQRAQELHPMNVRLQEQRIAQNDLLAQVNQKKADLYFLSEGIKKAKNEALEQFALNPSFGMLNTDERTRFENSTQFQHLAEFMFYGNDFQDAYNSKNENEMARIARLASLDGYEIAKNDKGEYTLSGNGRSIVINDENRAKVGKYLAANAAKEYAAILETSQKSTYARADRKIVADFSNKLVDVSQNKSLAAQLALVKKEIKAMPQGMKNTMLLRQILDDQLSSDLSDEEKIMEAQTAVISSPEMLSLLEQEGIRFTPGMDMAVVNGTFYDEKTKQSYNAYEMQQVLAERDKGRQYLEKLVANENQKTLALQAAAERKAKIDAVRLLNQKNAGDNTEAKGGEEQSKNKLPDWYKRNNAESYTDLSSEQQLQLGNIYERFKNSNSFLFKDLPSNPTEKDLDKLRLLDRSWQKLLKDEKLSPEKFPSPVKEEIDRLEDNKDHDEALKIRKRIAQIEKDNGYKIPEKNINVGHNPYDISQFSADSDKDVADEYSSLVGKVRKIEKKRKERNSKKR
jgi:hypothetical protein